MSQCPKCNGSRIVGGSFGPAHKPPVFRPAGLRPFSVTQDAGIKFVSAAASACLDCGLVWAELPIAKLSEFIRKHCRDDSQVQGEECLKCHRDRVACGKIVPDHRSTWLPAVFDPSGRQAFTFTLGGTRFTREVTACLECGFVSTFTSPAKLWQFIRNYCDRTPENAVAFEGVEPPSAWKEMWIGGIGVALIPMGYGVYCLYTRHAYFPGSRILDVRGWEAVVIGITYLALGAILHFQYFWGRHPGLYSRSSRLKQVAFLIFMAGMAYTSIRRFF